LDFSSLNFGGFRGREEIILMAELYFSLAISILKIAITPSVAAHLI
jgi:hypothetical protein